MENRPVFSIIMPSYNAQATIEIALRSIRMQDFDQKLIEILVIDGGSSDGTVDIARRYGARILENSERLPEYAKRIGFLQACGQYAIEMDTDEEFLHPDQLSKRYALLLEYPQIACVLADKLLPVKGYGICCSYLNRYGDPFTFFVYQGKGSVRKTFRKNITDLQGGAVLEFGALDRKPIGDGGTTLFSMDIIRAQWAEQMRNISFASAAFELVTSKNGYCGCIEGDDIRHHSAAFMKKYLSKLRFRIVNNIFQKAESGFSVRMATSPKLGRRKRLFGFYALSVVLPVFDSVRLALRHRDATMLLHIFYVYYVCVLTMWYYLLKVLGHSKANTSYAK